MFQKTLSTLFLIIAPAIYSADDTEILKIAATRAEYERYRCAMEAAERRDWRVREDRLAKLFCELDARAAKHIATDPLTYALYPLGYIEDCELNRRAADQTFLGRASQKMLDHVADPARKSPVFQPLKEAHGRFLQLNADLDSAQRSEHHKLVAQLKLARSEIIKKNRDTYNFFEDFTIRHFKSNHSQVAGFFNLLAACETTMREQAKAKRKDAAGR